MYFFEFQLKITAEKEKNVSWMSDKQKGAPKAG